MPRAFCKLFHFQSESGCNSSSLTVAELKEKRVRFADEVSVMGVFSGKSCRWSSKSDRASNRGRMLRWHQGWVALLCVVAFLTLLGAYSTFVPKCEVGNSGSGSSAQCRRRVRARNSVIEGGELRLDRPLQPLRAYSDEEFASRAVARDVLWHHSVDRPAGSKVAFMFLTRGPLPMEMVWVDFWAGHQGLYTVYVHASEGNDGNRFGWSSSEFLSAAISSRTVYWGRIEMVDAERRLLANALMDPSNQFFVLLSESCIPLYDFNYIYAFLMGAGKSFVETFDDPGPHGRGRYLPFMEPEIHVSDWRKGQQWIAVHRAHALLIVLDRVYYKKFKMFCKPGVDFNCVADEHYISTFLNVMDPDGVANRTLTFTDWSHGGWHPRSFTKDDLSPMLLAEMQSVTHYVHVTSEAQRKVIHDPCMWNDEIHPCFLFARKFTADSGPVLLQLLPKVIQTSFATR